MDRLHNSDVQRRYAAYPTDVHTETAAVPQVRSVHLPSYTASHSVML